jgi:hypothetical protein
MHVLISLSACRHFDPNGSGSVHYGEFQWAFFNRRSLARKYKRNTMGLTADKVIGKFHRYDINGDGVLSVKEFKKLLADFEIKLADDELEVLIDRFDRDGDGEIDVEEFKDFVDAEVNKLNSDHDSYESSSPSSSLTRSRSQPFRPNKSSDRDMRTNGSSTQPASAAMMLSQVLAAQSKIESKLGKSYFQTV